MHVSSSPLPRDQIARPAWQVAAILFLIALVVQLLAMLVIAHRRGSAAVYAYQSPDAAEYVSLARGFAWSARFCPIDTAGRIGGPDTWRTPGYPAVLAL